MLYPWELLPGAPGEQFEEPCVLQRWEFLAGWDMGRGVKVWGGNGDPIHGILHAWHVPSSLQPGLLPVPGLGSFLLLGLADYLQLALISVSFDSALSLLSPALSLPHHAPCRAHFPPEAPPLLWAAQSEGEFGAPISSWRTCPQGLQFRGCLVLSWGPRQLWLFLRYCSSYSE